jgi:hypothetical protein
MTTKRKTKPKIDQRAVQQRAAELFHVGTESYSLFPPGRVKGASLKSAMRAMLERTWSAVPLASPKGCDIRLTFVGDGAFCDAKVIWDSKGKMHADAIINLPSVGDGEALSRTQANAWTAYALHELSHVLFTPSRVWNEAIHGMANATGCTHGTARSWINALEDVDIERNLIAQQYARGFGPLVRGLVSHHIDQSYERNASSLQSLRSGNPSAFPFVLCYALRGYDVERSAALVALLPAPFRAVYDECRARMAAIPLRVDADSCGAGMRAVGDIATYAYKAIQALRANPPQPGEGDEPGENGTQTDLDSPQGDDQGEGEPADADEPGEPVEGDGDEPGDPTDGEDEGGDADGKPGDEGEGEPGDGDSGDGEPGEGDGTDRARTNDESEKMSSAPRRTRDDALIVQSDVMPDVYVDTELKPFDEREATDVECSYEDVVLDAMAHPADEYGADPDKIAAARASALKHSRTSSRLMMELRRMLTRTDIDSCEPGKKAGRLRVAALSRATVTDAVFERRERMDGINSAVSILVDGSGSMGTADRMIAAKDMALTLGHMLSQCVGVKFEVSVFDSGSNVGYDKDFALRMRDQMNDATGICNCALRVCKSFAEPVGKLYARLPAQFPRGGTPDYEAIVLAARRLRAVDAGRKILLVMTDGEGARADRVAGYVKQLEHDGITCIGIGLQFDMGDRFANRVTVTNVAELSSAASLALFRALGTRLGGGEV